MSDGDRHAGVALLSITALALIVVAALALGSGLLSGDGLRSPAVALVASCGGLLLLWIGVVRRSGSPPSAG
jgi:hypothetical protein